MIVSASYRTDIPAFYGDWFQRRLDAGFCYAYNPYAHTATRVALTPDQVEGFVFWTKHIAPFEPVLRAVSTRGIPFVVQHTLTGYPRALERRVPAVDRALAGMRAVAEMYGPHAVVWRYDPILLSSLTPADWHRTQFARLAHALAGSTDEVTVSFLQIYRKTGRRLSAAADQHGFAWRPAERDEERALLIDLAAIADDHGMRLTLCTQPHLAGVPHTSAARCVDVDRLSQVAGRPVTAKTRGNRPGCLCATSVDIGLYDTCPHGCVYCYAVSVDAKARQAFQAHDPAGPFLLPPDDSALRFIDPAVPPSDNLILPL
jgi:hypothetical protein